MVKKISAAVFALLILLVSCVSCGTAKMSEEEAEAIVKPLIEASHELNVIFFGEGLPAATDEELAADTSANAAVRIQASNYSYAPVSYSSKYQTEAELREATEKVFSKSYSNEIYDRVFVGFSTEYDDEAGIDSVTVYARYIENYGILTVAKSIDIMYKGRQYDYSTLKVEKSGKYYILITIDTISPDNEVIPAKLQIVKESNTWRLNSPTY